MSPLRNQAVWFEFYIINLQLGKVSVLWKTWVDLGSLKDQSRFATRKSNTFDQNPFIIYVLPVYEQDRRLQRLRSDFGI
jgi:hypothetical protein